MAKYYKFKTLKTIKNTESGYRLTKPIKAFIKESKKSKRIFTGREVLNEYSHLDRNWFKEITITDITERGKKYFNRVLDKNNIVLLRNLNNKSTAKCRLKPLHVLSISNVIAYAPTSDIVYVNDYELDARDVEVLTSWSNLKKFSIERDRLVLSLPMGGGEVSIKQSCFFFRDATNEDEDYSEEKVDFEKAIAEAVNTRETILQQELSPKDEKLLRESLEDWKERTYASIKEAESEKPNTKEKVLKTLKEKGTQIAKSNQDSFKTAATLEVGNAAISQLTKIVKKRIPRKFKKYADSPVLEVVMANAVSVAIQNFLPTNRKANILAGAMLDASMLKLVKEFDLPAMVNQLLSEVNIDSLLPGDDAKED